MVEIIEYAFVVLSSTLFAGASLAVYSQYSGFGAAAESRAAFSVLVTLAWQAMGNGSSTSSILFPDSTVACSNGTFLMSSATGTESVHLGVACDFNLKIGRGLHSASFLSGPAQLSLTVA